MTHFPPGGQVVVSCAYADPGFGELEIIPYGPAMLAWKRGWYGGMFRELEWYSTRERVTWSHEEKEIYHG